MHRPPGGSFAHLHVRSGFSYGYGVATPEELVEAAAAADMRSTALTDGDGLYGIPRFLRAAEERGVLPVVGVEVSVESGGHAVLLAEGMEGYRSLSKLVTAYRCSSEHRRVPLCLLDTVLEHAGGLICLTGAVPFGFLPRLVLSGEGQTAREVLGLLLEAFGPEGVFVELTDDRTAGSRRRMRQVALSARRHGVPVLATNEVAYLRPSDHRLHEVLVAASGLTSLPGPGYRPTDQLWFKPSEEMERLFTDYPEALRNAARVAERCAGSVKLTGKVHVPTVRPPGGETPERRLHRLAMEGVRRRYGDRVRGEVLRRLRRELDCMRDLGFSSYFLLAREAVDIAREKEVPVTGRGSAANSVVAYCLGLTQPEPLANRLLFERFLHEHRTDPPDVDLDLDSEGRDGVRDELMGRYGDLGAAVAATAHTLSLRGAVRVAARALGHTPGEVNDLARHVTTRFTDRGRIYNAVSGWTEVLRQPAMRGHPLQERGKHGMLMDLSWRLSGRLWQAGTHNGGVVFGNEHHRLSELMPLEPSGKPGLVRCQYDKDDLEYIGVPKLDLLGLKMHMALRKAGELASARLGRRVYALSPPPDDKETYRLIRTGRNVGMFQLESPGQMHLSARLKPRRFSDLVAQISLFRPGPVQGDLVTPYVMRRNGREPYSVPLPELDEVLRGTYGVILYQEQVLEVAQVVAGFSFAEGDALRKAMTRDRGPDAMSRIREEFVGRAVGRGVPEATARKVFGWTEGFGVYGFPKAHGASFAELAYASAYARTHYPAEFFCGVLNSQPMGFYSPRAVLNEARRIGLEILPPDVNLSGEGFTVEEEGAALRVGLIYCKGLSKKAVTSITSEREERPFSSAADLYHRTSVERDVLENLVKGGFLDFLAGGRANRGRLLSKIGGLPKKRRRDDAQPEMPLEHPTSRWEEREDRGAAHLPLAETARERMEWEALGLNVARHPLAPYRRALRGLGVTPGAEVSRLPHGTRVRAAGLVECLQCPPTKSGHPVWFLVIEDEGGLLQATIFERVYEEFGWLLHHRGAVLVEGTVEQDRRRGFSFLVRRIDDLRGALDGAVIPTARATPSSGAFLRAGRRGRRAG